MSLAIPKSAIFTTRPVAFVVNRQFLQSKVQGDQVNMAVFFRYLEKSDVSSVSYKQKSIRSATNDILWFFYLV